MPICLFVKLRFLFFVKSRYLVDIKKIIFKIIIEAYAYLVEKIKSERICFTMNLKRSIDLLGKFPNNVTVKLLLIFRLFASLTCWSGIKGC